MGRRRATATVRTSENPQQMAIRVIEVEPAPIIPGVDLVVLVAPRVGPIGETLLTNPLKDLVKFALAHQEGVVLGRDLTIGALIVLDIYIVQRGIAHPYHRKRAEQQGRRETQELCQERCRGFFIVRGNDRMVYLNGPRRDPSMMNAAMSHGRDCPHIATGA